MKQWAGVFGYTYGSPQQTLANNPSAPYTKYVYGPNLVGVYGSGVTHNVPINGQQDLEWFGILGASSTSVPPTSVPTPTTTLATSTRTTAPPAVTTTASPSGCGAPRWGQCGGQGWVGCTDCGQYTCRALNQWYSQCL